MRVAIAGGGNVGVHIAVDLCDAGYEVLVIEVDGELVDQLRDLHPVTWFTGDACEIRTLEAVQLDSYDVVIAATGDDEDNLVISLLARQEYGVPKVVARVNHPKNKWLFNKSWGVDVSVSTPHLLTALVTEAVSVGSLVHLLEFEGGQANIIEVTLAEDSPALGRTLAELELPRDSTIVAVVRADHVIVPRSETVLAPGDEVLVLMTAAVESEVNEALTRQRSS